MEEPSEARRRFEGAFDAAGVAMVEKVHVDLEGVMVVHNGLGGFVEGDRVVLAANRDFGSGDMTMLASRTGSGARIILFGESDLGIPAPGSISRDQAAEKAIGIIRDKHILFFGIGTALEGARALPDRVTLPRNQAACAIFGHWDEVAALVRTATMQRDESRRSAARYPEVSPIPDGDPGID